MNGLRRRKLSEAYAAIIGRNLNMDTIMPSTRLHRSRSFFERPNMKRQTNTTTRTFENWWSSFSLKSSKTFVSGAEDRARMESLTLSFFSCCLLATKGFAWRDIAGILGHTSRRSLPTELCPHRTGTAVDLSPEARSEELRRCRCESATGVSWSIPNTQQI